MPTICENLVIVYASHPLREFMRQWLTVDQMW